MNVPKICPLCQLKIHQTSFSDNINHDPIWDFGYHLWCVHLQEELRKKNMQKKNKPPGWYCECGAWFSHVKDFGQHLFDILIHGDLAEHLILGETERVLK